MGLLNLADELLFLIVGYLSLKDLSHLLLTCRRLESTLTPHFHKRGLQDVGELTALQWAAEKGHTSLAKLALSDGADIEKADPRSTGGTSLHLAVKSKHIDVIRLLIDHGAKVSANDSGRMTPLHYAVLHKQEDAAKVLLEAGAEMVIVSASMDTPAMLAATLGSVNTMKAFLEAGFDINTRGPQGRTVLHAAAMECETGVLEYLLLEAGGEAIINVQDSVGLSPLALAIEKHYRDGMYAINLLLQHGADPEMKDRLGVELQKALRELEPACLALPWCFSG